MADYFSDARLAKKKGFQSWISSNFTETQLKDFTASFVHRLPKYMQEALERRETAA